MSVVIIGGNDCMVCRYKNLCKEYGFKSKVFTQPVSTMADQIGSPDLLILFTNTVSHKMVKCALDNVCEKKTKIARSHSSSMSSLKNILDTHVSL